jgi:hypothetical protein
LVAISFHASVYHRFGAMEEDLNEAARIKQTMEWDELKAFGYYLQSVQLDRQGIDDTVRAFEYAIEAESLGDSIFFETEDIQILKEDAREKKQQAKVDRSTIAGMALAKQAKDENERSEAMMNRTAKEEAKGKKKLREAQETLEVAEAAQNRTKLDKGICNWASVICNVVRSTTNGGREQNQTAPVTASDAVINANGDIQDALQMIHEAELERSEAIELHKNASIHVNQSTAILRDVQAFKNQSEANWKDPENYSTSAEEEEAAAKRDEERAKQEEADITLKEIEMINDTEYSMYLFESVIKDCYNEQHTLEKMNSDLELVRKREIEWEQKMEEATHHVAKAGWEALVASISGLCLLVLVGGHIVATFRYQRSLRWILREPPYFSQDLWYLVCHLCIFVLAMGYIGELLMVFHEQTNIARAGITVVFSLSAAVLQVTLLHILPSVHELFLESRIDASSAIRFLVEHVVIRKGAIIALVSAIEILLCWCWMGTVAFKQVNKVNTYVAWSVVICVSVGHGIFFRTREYAVADYSPTRCGMEFGILSDSTNNVSNDNERNSLLVPSLTPSFPRSSKGSVPGGFQGSFVVPSPNAHAIGSGWRFQVLQRR